MVISDMGSLVVNAQDRPALRELAEHKSLARISAGEAMSSTVVQAKILSCVLHSDGFKKNCWGVARNRCSNKTRIQCVDEDLHSMCVVHAILHEHA